MSRFRKFDRWLLGLIFSLVFIFLFFLSYRRSFEFSFHQNMLSKSHSPYLLLHKDNPIAWQEWSEDLFDSALEENRLIFMSIGYSTCHWCHVMNRESFSDSEVASFLNRHYISVKIDREERPDLDQVYMALVEKLGYQQGWPLNVWLTPEGRPFYAANYLTKENLLLIAEKISRTWEEDPDQVESVVYEMNDRNKKTNIHLITDHRALVAEFVEGFVEREERIEKRLLTSSRFPRASEIRTLLSIPSLLPRAQTYLIETLKNMTSRGLRDPVLGGFFRYTTDPDWKNPHYEKTLYDNAQMARVLLEGGLKLHRSEWKDIAHETILFLITFLRSPDGGFYSGIDAESLNPETGKKEEGFFYGWKGTQLETLKLEKSFEKRFSIYQPPKSELFFLHGMSSADEKLREKLREIRLKKPHPEIDRKVITSWNAILISTLLRFYQIERGPKFLRLARETAHFILKSNFHHDHLYRYSIDRQRADIETPEDYAFFIQALLDLYQADFDLSWLEWSQKLQELFENRFWNPEEGLYISDAFLRNPESGYDHSKDEMIPPVNVVAMGNHRRLFALTKGNHEKKADILLKKLSGLKSHAVFYPSLVRILNLFSKKEVTVVVAGAGNDESTQKVLEFVYRHTEFPITLALRRTPADEERLPLLKGKNSVGQVAQFYLCLKEKCLLPTDSPEELIQSLFSIYGRTAKD